MMLDKHAVHAPPRRQGKGRGKGNRNGSKGRADGGASNWKKAVKTQKQLLRRVEKDGSALGHLHRERGAAAGAS